MMKMFSKWSLWVSNESKSTSHGQRKPNYASKFEAGAGELFSKCLLCPVGWLRCSESITTREDNCIERWWMVLW